MRIKKNGVTTIGRLAWKEPDDEMREELEKEAEELRTILVDEEYISPYDESMAYARLLYIARKQQLLTVEEAAIALNFPLRRYMLLESGEKLPSTNENRKICIEFGIDPILAKKQIDRALLAARRICVMEHAKDRGKVTKTARFSVALPWRIREWAETEAKIRKIPLSGFVALVVASRYRNAMRSLVDPDMKIEEEFAIENDNRTPDGILVYDEDADGENKKYFSDPHGSYEWGAELGPDDESGDI